MDEMKSEYPIWEVHVFPLTRAAGRLTLLREEDHLLRRFGQLDLIDLVAGEQTDFTLRSEADRFLFPIAGSVKSSLLDLRALSPSKNARAEITLEANQPQGLLVPFGVACSLGAKSAARIVILSTHSESHPEDRTISRDDLDQYAASQ
jgi:hypothetical protein